LCQLEKWIHLECIDYDTLFLCAVFDEAALTDDLLVQLVEVLKKHKASSDEEKNFDSKTDKKDSGEGTKKFYTSKVQLRYWPAKCLGRSNRLSD